MALKPDRYHVESEIAFYCNDVVNRGVVLGIGSSGSGVALDQNTNVALTPGTNLPSTNVAFVPGANVSGVKPIGMLMNDMVNIDLTKFHLNFYKDTMPVGGKCTLWKKGWVVTDQVFPGATPVAGDPAYLAASGTIHNAVTNFGARVGTFLSAKDEKGFAKVEINLPN